MTRPPHDELQIRTRRLGRALVGWAALLGSTVTVPPAAAMAANHPPASKQVFEKLILARIQAYGRGDVRAYDRLVTTDFVHISDMGGRRTAKQLVPYVASGKSDSTRFAVRDLSFRVRGQLAVVDCEVVVTDVLTSQRLREMDVFEAHGTRWVYLAHAETIVQEKDVSPWAVGSQTLQQYAGQYSVHDSGTDLLSVSDGQLWGQDAPGTERTPLIPIAADTFVMSGDPAVIIFERNAQGKVIGYALRLGNGQVIRATRTP